MKNHRLKIGRRIAPLLVALAVAALWIPPPAAHACGQNCPRSQHDRMDRMIRNEHIDDRIFMTERMKELQIWFMNDFFEEYIAPAVVLMTQQLTLTGMHQMFILGTFFDASHQLETQRLMRTMAAEAHKNYHPSMEICVMGTAARGLAPTGRGAEITAGIMMRRSQNRQLGHTGTATAGGVGDERAIRLAKFKSTYCDVNDNNGSMGPVCAAAVPADRINKDIDYARTIGNAMTLDVDFTNTASTSDEEDLLALGANLFAHKPFDRVPRSVLQEIRNQDDYLDIRSVVAKRSIVENSFYAIAGMKAAGSAVSNTAAAYTAEVLEQLGMPTAEAQAALGARPSYYALMNVMAQKIYQRPEFFSSLYDKHVNVMRKDVAMQAIDLMLSQDSYKSELRTEALLALFLELETIKYQRAIQNRINWFTETGGTN